MKKLMYDDNNSISYSGLKCIPILYLTGQGISKTVTLLLFFVVNKLTIFSIYAESWTKFGSSGFCYLKSCTYI